MNSDIDAFDPREDYDARTPPEAFMRELKALDPALTAAWHNKRNKWMVAQIVRAPIYEFSSILGPSGQPAVKSVTYRRLAVEIQGGEVDHLGPHVIASLRRYSPRFHGNPQADDHAVSQAAAEAAYKDRDDDVRQRVGSCLSAFREAAEETGTPMLTVQERSRVEAAAEKRREKSKRRFMRRVVRPAGASASVSA